MADKLLECFIEDYTLVHQVDEAEVREDDELMDDLRRLAALSHQWWTATAATLRDGLCVEREHETDDGEIITWTESVVHPAEKASWRINGRERSIRKKHGIGLATVTEAMRRQKSLEEMASDEA